MTSAPEPPPTRKTRNRSPNFPGIGLKEAIEKARTLYQHERLNPAPGSVVFEHWGYSKSSSSAMIALAALRSFGLLEGRGEAVKLSDLARDIVQDTRPESATRNAAIRRAALNPKIHQDVRSRFPEGGSDLNVQHYLVREKDFTEKGAREFIKQFRATLAFAGVRDGDKIPEGGGDESEGDAPPPRVSVGDHVQWNSQGLDQFPFARRVTDLSEDGTHVFVEGSDTGLPTDQVRRADAPLQPKGNSPRPPQRSGMNQDTLTLDEGQVILQWPASISQENYEDLKDWLDLMSRRIKRAVRDSEGQPEETE